MSSVNRRWGGGGSVIAWRWSSDGWRGVGVRIAAYGGGSNSGWWQYGEGEGALGWKMGSWGGGGAGHQTSPRRGGAVTSAVGRMRGWGWHVGYVGQLCYSEVKVKVTTALLRESAS